MKFTKHLALLSGQILPALFFFGFATFASVALCQPVQPDEVEFTDFKTEPANQMYDAGGQLAIRCKPKITNNSTASRNYSYTVMWFDGDNDAVGGPHTTLLTVGAGQTVTFNEILSGHPVPQTNPSTSYKAVYLVSYDNGGTTVIVGGDQKVFTINP